MIPLTNNLPIGTPTPPTLSPGRVPGEASSFSLSNIDIAIKLNSDNSLSFQAPDGKNLLQSLSLGAVKVESQTPNALSFRAEDGKTLTVKPHPTVPNALDFHWDNVFDKKVGFEISNTPAFEPDTQWAGLAQMIHHTYPMSAANTDEQRSIMLPRTPLIPSDNGPQGLATIARPILYSDSGVIVQSDLHQEKPIHVSFNQEVGVQHNSFVEAGYVSPVPEQQLPGQSIAPIENRPKVENNSANAKGDGEIAFYSQESTLKQTVVFPEIGKVGDIKSTLVKSAEALELVPFRRPSDAEIRRPVACTWAELRDDLNEEKIIDFAQSFIDNGLKPKEEEWLLGIDDNWTGAKGGPFVAEGVHFADDRFYGDYSFPSDRFPAGDTGVPGKPMIDKLHDMGFKACVWVPPFFEKDSANYQEAEAKGLLIKNASSGDTQNCLWWQRGDSRTDNSGVLDLRIPEAKDWWIGKLESFMAKTGVDAIKFDGGEGTHIGHDSALPQHQLAGHVVDVARRVSDKDNVEAVEVRCGYGNSGQQGVMTRVYDIDSAWTNKNGLGVLIPTALTNSLLGIGHTMGDMIAGNFYGGDHEIPKEEISPEFFNRFTQASLLLSSIQFSMPPWGAGKTTDEQQGCTGHIRDLLTARTELVNTHLIPASDQQLDTGVPPLRPMSMGDGAAGQAKVFAIKDQYMIGDNLVVAPAVTEGATSREVWLPRGDWQPLDIQPGGTISRDAPMVAGDQWLTVDTPIDKLPLFERSKPSSTADNLAEKLRQGFSR